MEAFAYFPTIVYRDERPDLAEKMLPLCMPMLDQARNPNIPFTQSAHLAGDHNFNDVSDYLLASSSEILHSQGYDVNKYDFYLSGLWVQETTKYAGTNVHVHKNSQICGWMFLEASEGSSYPVYHDTRMNKQMVELDFVQECNVLNATNQIHFNNVIPGTVLFSNSWMQHQLIAGSAEGVTRCIHFIVSHKDRMCNIC